MRVKSKTKTRYLVGKLLRFQNHCRTLQLTLTVITFNNSTTIKYRCWFSNVMFIMIHIFNSKIRIPWNYRTCVQFRNWNINKCLGFLATTHLYKHFSLNVIRYHNSIQKTNCVTSNGCSRKYLRDTIANTNYLNCQ